MARPEAFRIGLGTEYIGKTRINVVQKPEQSRAVLPPVSSTARHEAKHAAVNPDIVNLATIVAGPGYLGKVETSRFDPIVAMASNEEEGNSHDKAITRYMGFSEGACASEANERLNKRKGHVYAIAHALDQKKTLTGSEVRNIFKKVDEEKKKPLERKADVFISDTNGGQKEINNVDINGSTVMVPGEYVDFTVPDKPDLSKINNSDTDGSVSSEPEDLPWSWVHKYENGLPCAA